MKAILYYVATMIQGVAFICTIGFFSIALYVGASGVASAVPWLFFAALALFDLIAFSSLARVTEPGVEKLRQGIDSLLSDGLLLAYVAEMGSALKAVPTRAMFIKEVSCA